LKILHVEPKRYDDESRLRLSSIGEVDYFHCAHQADFLTAMARERYDALFVRLGLACDRTLFDLAKKLRYVVTPTTGTDHIDLEEATERSIRIISLRGEEALLDTIASTAEHAWTLVLALSRQLRSAQADVTAGHWRREPFIARELYGRTLGILGCGRLGRMVARYGLAFNMRVIAHDREPRQLTRAPGVQGVGLDELLSESDFLTIHLPLDLGTTEYLNAERIGKIKRGAYLVNTARGELVDEGALLRALESGALAGAALDVLAGDSTWDREPPPRHPLIQYAAEHENLLITPHVGGYGIDALQGTRRFIIEKFITTVERGVDRNA